jgi:hypothetical protein
MEHLENGKIRQEIGKIVSSGFQHPLVFYITNLKGVLQMKRPFFISIALLFGTAVAVTAQEAVIDFRYNVIQFEPARNYLNWSIGNKNTKDSYDARTGASIARSTRELDTVRYDSSATRRYTIPVGLRQLLLFPICPTRYTDLFHLTVLEEGQKLIIRFILDGTLYQIRTDDRRQIDIRNGFSKAEGITVTNALVPVNLKPEYILPGGRAADWNSVDWSKIQWRPDTAEANASRKYSGVLTVGYTNGVLTIKGTLTPQ